MFTAFFDTCVLFPIIKTDLALRCAEEKMFSIRWSDKVLEELSIVLQRPPTSLPAERAEHRISIMRQAFPHAEVTAWEPLEHSFSALPDPADRHVAAAAAFCNADVIVTENLKDFPLEALCPHGLFAQNFDDFMCDLWELKPSYPSHIFRMLENIAEIRGIDWRLLTNQLASSHLMPNFAQQVYSWHLDNN